MRKLIASTLFMALCATTGSVIRAQDKDDRRHDHDDKDHGDHRDRGERHGDDEHRGGDDRRGGDERHDNGNHNGWDKHVVRDDHRDWDDDRDRMQPGRHYPHGRYEHVKQSFIATSIDYRTRRVMLYDQSNWVVASYDLDRCRDWQWQRDNVFVYDDDRHPGWYLLFNARLGRYVHVEYFGGR